MKSKLFTWISFLVLVGWVCGTVFLLQDLIREYMSGTPLLFELWVVSSVLVMLLMAFSSIDKPKQNIMGTTVEAIYHQYRQQVEAPLIDHLAALSKNFDDNNTLPSRRVVRLKKSHWPEQYTAEINMCKGIRIIWEDDD